MLVLHSNALRACFRKLTQRARFLEIKAARKICQRNSCIRPLLGDLDQSSTELAAATRSDWLPNGSSGVTRKLLRNRSYFVVISLVYLAYGIQKGPRMVHDGVIMTAAADRRLAVGDDLGEFEQKNLDFLVVDGFKDTARSALTD